MAANATAAAVMEIFLQKFIFFLSYVYGSYFLARAKYVAGDY